MNYLLRGHDRENAVHDLLICLLPDEPHRRVSEPETGDICVSELETMGDGSLFSLARVTLNGRESTGECRRAAANAQPGELTRAAGYAVKTALYRALVPLLESPPVWGSLTGVKPAKPVRVAIEAGLPRERAAEFVQREYYVERTRAELCVNAAEYAISAERALERDEIQVYAGIPFCPSRCAYCSFVSMDTGRSGGLIAPYLQALSREIEAAGVAALSRKIGSIYVGGGTPTVLTAPQLDELLSELDGAFGFAGCREVTVEAGRPDTLDAQKLAVLSRHGVTRLSINPQSMNDRALDAVGRPHTADCTIKAYNMARSLGNFAINMDLIAGLPGDSAEGFLDSVRKLIALRPENITIHSLALKKGADMRFGARGTLEAATLDEGYQMLAAAGYLPYYLYRQKYTAGGLENVGFCQKGWESHYNICMMEELCDVLALGAGGVSKLCSGGGEKIVRVSNPKYPREYIGGIEQIVSTKLGLSRC